MNMVGDPSSPVVQRRNAEQSLGSSFETLMLRVI